MRKLTFAVLIGALLISWGCKRTAEDAGKSWERNQKTIDELAALYPGFDAALKERQKAAKAIFDAAQGLSGDEAAKKIDAANSALTKGFVGQLKGLDKKLKGLRSKLVDAATGTGDENDRAALKVVHSDISKTLDGIDAKLKAGAKDAKSADIVLKQIMSDVSAAEKNVKKLGTSAKTKKDDKKAAAAEKKAEKADWTCEYCQSKNKHTHTKCESCGASRGGKK